MNVSFGIQAHPRRALQAAALADRIGGDVEIVWDPDPGGPPSAWRTFRHLLATTPSDASHRFQIQDDALPCPGFREAVLRAVEARPHRLLVFFVGGNPQAHAQAVLQACARDEPWVELSHAHWVPAVATCWPAHLAAHLLAWVDRQRWPAEFTADDEILGRWAREADHRPLASVPSLVEHEDLVPSLVGRRTAYGYDRGRVAACFIGADCGNCAQEIDWTMGPR